MISRALDSNNDLVLKNGRFATVKDGDQVVQMVRSRLLFYFTEWFLDKRAGVPWFQEIFTKPFNAALAENIIKQQIEQTSGIEKLISFSMTEPNPNDRILKIAFEAETVFGVVGTKELLING